MIWSHCLKEELKVEISIASAYDSQRVNTDGETKEDLRNKDRNFSASLVFCVKTLEPIMIQTGSAPQNDSLNLSLVKDT